MDFKIDTRDTYSVITPVCAEISVIMTDELRATMDKMRQSGSQNFIVALQNCTSVAAGAIEALVAMHSDSYEAGRSLVFTGMQPSVMATLKETETDTIINLAPKMIEAIDIINMDILERDLYSEEN